MEMKGGVETIVCDWVNLEKFHPITYYCEFVMGGNE